MSSVGLRLYIAFVTTLRFASVAWLKREYKHAAQVYEICLAQRHCSCHAATACALNSVTLAPDFRSSMQSCVGLDRTFPVSRLRSHAFRFAWRMQIHAAWYLGACGLTWRTHIMAHACTARYLDARGLTSLMHIMAHACTPERALLSVTWRVHIMARACTPERALLSVTWRMHIMARACTPERTLLSGSTADLACMHALRRVKRVRACQAAAR